MSVKIDCTHCEEELHDWKEYAQHLLDNHPDDIERCIWARDALADVGTLVK